MRTVYTNVSADRLHITTGEWSENDSCCAERCAMYQGNGRYVLYRARALADCDASLDDAARWVATGELPR